MTREAPAWTRRRALRRLAALGIGAAAPPMLLRAAMAADPRAGLLRAEGEVLVNGRPAHPGAAIGPGSRVETGPGALAVFVAGGDALLLRAQSRIEIDEEHGLRVLRHARGAVLSVFGGGRRAIVTPTASIGVQDASCYLESSPERTTFCLCRGHALVVPKADPNRRKSLRTLHHEHPVHIERAAGARAVVPAKFIHHSDAELAMLEALLGR